MNMMGDAIPSKKWRHWLTQLSQQRLLAWDATASFGDTQIFVSLRLHLAMQHTISYSKHAAQASVIQYRYYLAMQRKLFDCKE